LVNAAPVQPPLYPPLLWEITAKHSQPPHSVDESDTNDVKNAWAALGHAFDALTRSEKKLYKGGRRNPNTSDARWIGPILEAKNGKVIADTKKGSKASTKSEAKKTAKKEKTTSKTKKTSVKTSKKAEKKTSTKSSKAGNTKSKAKTEKKSTKAGKAKAAKASAATIIPAAEPATEAEVLAADVDEFSDSETLTEDDLSESDITELTEDHDSSEHEDLTEEDGETSENFTDSDLTDISETDVDEAAAALEKYAQMRAAMANTNSQSGIFADQAAHEQELATYQLDSVKRKRIVKMNKHKRKKRRRSLRHKNENKN
jgi:hypothetical protein